MPDKKSHHRIWSYGSNTVISSIVFLALLVFVVLIAERHPWRVDLTESGSFSLSQQTRKILDSLQEPIVIKAFYASLGPERAQARDLLETYQYHNKNVSYEFIDPDRQPEVARQYDIRSYGTLVLEGYQKKQTVQRADEESLSNAIFKLSRSREKKTYFLTGHGEHSIKDADKNGYSSLDAALTKENYQIASLNLMQQAQVPDDAALLIVAGPTKPLLPPEVESLKQYLERNGKLLLLLDPYQDGGLKALLESYGVELKEDIVIDKLSRVFGGSFLMPVVMEYGFHKITDGFNVATFYPEARSVRIAKKAPDGVHLLLLASTSQEAWAETDRDMLNQGQASFDANQDVVGPVPIAALAEIEQSKAQSQGVDAKPTDEETSETELDATDRDKAKALLVVIGDSDFVDNTHFGLSGNGDFFLNVVNFLAEEETLITIEPREKKGQPLILTQTQARSLLWVSLVMVPLMILLIGFAVYRVRRSQR
jgi:ABC-type uncharacterized transport system involved in gliding motility auxiliary subunit